VFCKYQLTPEHNLNKCQYCVLKTSHMKDTINIQYINTCILVYMVYCTCLLVNSNLESIRCFAGLFIHVAFQIINWLLDIDCYKLILISSTINFSDLIANQMLDKYSTEWWGKSSLLCITLFKLLKLLYSKATELQVTSVNLKTKPDRAVRRSRSSGIFCRCRCRSWKTPAKTPADKIMKNYFIFQRTFGIKWEN
jgi:hypothetical protein